MGGWDQGQPSWNRRCTFISNVIIHNKCVIDFCIKCYIGCHQILTPSYKLYHAGNLVADFCVMMNLISPNTSCAQTISVLYNIQGYIIYYAWKKISLIFLHLLFRCKGGTGGPDLLHVYKISCWHTGWHKNITLTHNYSGCRLKHEIMRCVKNTLHNSTNSKYSTHTNTNTHTNTYKYTH